MIGINDQELSDRKIKMYNVEFRAYGTFDNRDVKMIAYSPKQAKKFFYDWWRKKHGTYALVIMAYELSEKVTQKILKELDMNLDDLFKRQQDYIYRSRCDEDK